MKLFDKPVMYDVIDVHQANRHAKLQRQTVPIRDLGPG